MSPALSLAGFQVTIIGRPWVTAEEQTIVAMDFVTHDSGLVKTESGLMAAPRNNFIDSMSLATLRFARPQTGEHGCLDLLHDDDSVRGRP
jgi:hypothetical protein